ncbi:MAG: S8 family serine peptidase [Ignavibacteria bacterium]|jgi:subtilisin family serine protease|nr:S8 family serine peptidase [Ignavibacteria bacterium]
MKKINLLLIPIVIFAFLTAGFIFSPVSGNDGDYFKWTKSDNTTVNIPVKVLNEIKVHFASKELPDWSQMSPDKDGYEGTRTLELYDYIKSQGIGDPKPVVVAVMDSGFELDHPDLKDNIWNNETEINGQAGVDDDNNGYVDDFHGWNFLGKAVALNLEVTREYARLKKEGVSETDPYFADVIKEYNTKKQEDQETYDYIKMMNEGLREAVTTLKNAGVTTDPKKLQEISETLSGKEKEAAEKILGIYLMAQATPEDMEGYEKEYENKVKLLYDLNFNPSDLIGDNAGKMDEKNYGDNDPSVKTSSHGTHVAGIIGSVKKGIGQAPFVKLMYLRLVPADGDERDKDVANGIRYAADNGATVINLSAGKYYPNNPKYVMDAIKYAESKGVLFVVAAGNEGTNIETRLNYPPKFYKEGSEIKYFPNLLCVGASTWMKQYDSNLDPMNYSRKSDLCAPFSNYSNKVVDVFAPGMQINSTVPGKTYKMMSGTSMASPVAAGVAAILKGYFPDLTPKQIKEIMMNSSRKYDNLLVKTKELGKVQFATLSKSGGVVDAYNAFMMAQKMK